MSGLSTVVEGTRYLDNLEHVRDFCLIGSACYHPEPKDIDFLVLVEADSFLQVARWMFGPDWNLCEGSYDDQTDQWGAIRKGDINLIVTVNAGWYERAKLANEVCRALKLMDKGDRIVVYRVVRDGYDAEAANARRDGTR